MWMQIKMFFKLLKLRRKIRRLKLAKENTYRIEQGLSPIYPFSEILRMYLVDKPLDFIYHALCPCCIYDRYRHEKRRRRPAPTTWYGRMIFQGTYENQVLKSVLGFLIGILINYLIYLYMIYQLRFQLLTATVWALIAGNVLTLGLAFSDPVRCIALLIVPSVCTGKGRTALLATAMVMTFNGPAMNAGENAMRLAGTIQCGQELLRNTTIEVIKEALTPIRTIYAVLKKVVKELAELAKKIKAAFLAVVKVFRDIVDSIKQAFAWLASVVEECNERVGTPAKKCYKSIDEAVEKCEVALGKTFSWLCYVAHVAYIACAAMSLVVALCNLPKAVSENILEPIKKLVKTLVAKIKYQLYVKIAFSHHMNYTLEQSKSVTDIRKDIMDEIRQRVDIFDLTLEWTDVVLFLIIFTIVWKAFWYRQRYLTQDRYDNIYITFTVRDIDERRLDLGKETLLPLRHDEKKIYVKTNAWSFAHAEKKKLFSSLAFFSGPAMQAVFYMFMDTTLFWLLKTIRKYGAFDAEIEIPASIELHVRGSGFLARMYRTIIKAFKPLLKLMPRVDTTPCLPVASIPDYNRYKLILFLLWLVLLLIVGEAYGLRFRHVICSWFAPHREKERAIWLYNNILRQRGGFVKFMRRRLREKYGIEKFTKSAAEKTSLIEYLATKSEFLRQIFKFFGYTEKKFCIVCSKPGFQDDYETFKHCQTPGCKGIYCDDCFRDLHNMCTICMHPIEYGDLSDLSEELDSSDEEEILRKREEARLRAMQLRAMQRRSERSTELFELEADEEGNVDAQDLYEYTQQLAMRAEDARHGRKDRVSMEIFSNEESDESTDDNDESDFEEQITIV
ncbi:DC-STAMP domain-containing protein 2-like [Paramacrobiotus metropolitanus]|uniref:DC-STAMP domain-containing protein 2-like n=1 Tax=Paramacrobiotus metropolitanus TaxID=2943436 RepID=UPI002445FE96|nr:DC-STAMP domain-containing protein 2-like [Paramacrobiotus metropolitanus]XP_055341807.1 DC-STAMP domain-containing protein 2-like [Paramacrobiotus metropolitanus]XP_055341809.1 DC-STAMP domain-containing protein 2-like [Paramacrobiotus metropolitanus]XP_055341810.1 DC-STAMP domain-containing protein 2-like [Paramacrobiotus metropolitanus]